MHPLAAKAAEAAECAGRQGRFWDMHDRLFGDQAHLDEPSLQQRGQALHLNPTAFAACLDGQAAARVREDAKGAEALHFSGTPTFLLGVVQRDGRLKVSQLIPGARPASDFENALDKLLTTVQTTSR
jgi:protein-disulfide isomerase